MKGKLIAGALALGALMAVVPVAEAAVPVVKSVSSIVRTHEPQEWRRQQTRRVVTRTRIVRVGFRRYRETYRTVYLPNGRIRTTMVSRVGI
jgi:hypothetical protein